MEETPAGTLGGDAAAGDIRTPHQYALLKARFKLLQEDALALAAAYEEACEELRYQEECKAVMVEKLAQIRVRRMNAYLRVPENGMMFFMEESKTSVRKLHPTASRREIRRLLQREWDTMLEEEQHEWHTRLHSVAAKARKQEESKKSTWGSQRKKPTKISSVTSVSSTPTSTLASVSGVKATTVKRKAPPSVSTPRSKAPDESTEKPKKKHKTEADTKIDAAADIEDTDSNVVVKSTPKAKPVPATKTLRPKATPRAKKLPVKEENDSNVEEKAPSTPKKSTKKTSAKATAPNAVDAGAVSPEKQATTPRKSPAKPSKTATSKAKTSATPKKKGAADTSTPRKKAAPKAAKRTPPKKKRVKLLASDSDLDDDDDDDDDEEEGDNQKTKRRGRGTQDDDSPSSGGGSGSDEDDEDQLAQLPTGAFG